MVRGNIPFLFSKNYWLENEVLKRRCLLRVEIFLQLSVLWYVLTTTTQSKARKGILTNGKNLFLDEGLCRPGEPALERLICFPPLLENISVAACACFNSGMRKGRDVYAQWDA